MPFQKIEVIAPYVLRPDQNFYDQPPFEQIMGEIKTAYSKITLESLRTAATKISHAQYRELTLEGEDEINPVSRSPEQTILWLATSKGRVDAMKREALTHLDSSLDEYPKLKRYIATQLEYGSYTASGKRSKIKVDSSESGQMLFVADSYAYWMNRRLHRAPLLGRPKRKGDIELTGSIVRAQEINEALVAGKMRGEELRSWPLLRAIKE